MYLNDFSVILRCLNVFSKYVTLIEYRVTLS